MWKNRSRVSDGCLTPKRTGRLTVGRNITLTLTDSLCGLEIRVPGYRTEMYRFVWGTKWIYICYVEESRRPLWSSGPSSWLQIQVFWEVVGLERDPLSHVSTTEYLLGRNSSGSGLENWEYGRKDPSLWPRDTLDPRKLVLTSPTSGGRSFGIVCWRTKATELLGSITQLWRRYHVHPRRQSLSWSLIRSCLCPSSSDTQTSCFSLH
jgi:hypothetical protein